MDDNNRVCWSPPGVITTQFLIHNDFGKLQLALEKHKSQLARKTNIQRAFSFVLAALLAKMIMTNWHLPNTSNRNNAGPASGSKQLL